MHDDVTVAPSPAARRGRGWWIWALIIVGTIGALIVSVAEGIRLIVAANKPPTFTAGTPGYETFGGPHGRPIRVGSPWGRSCAPVVLNVSDDVPDAHLEELVRVVEEARRSGINVAVQSRRHTWRPGKLYPAGLTKGDVEFVPVFAADAPGPLRPDGRAAGISFAWDAALDKDRRHERLISLSGTLHLPALGDDRVAYRRIFRKLLGFTQGIRTSTAAGSSLQQGGTPDAFSSGDIAAMKVMSGCSRTAIR